MLPPEEGWLPDATLEATAPELPEAEQGGETCMPKESQDAISPILPETPVSSSDDEPEPTAGAPGPPSSDSGKLHLLALPPKRIRLRAKTSVPADVRPPVVLV